MTLSDILSNNNSTEDLKSKIAEKALTLQLQNTCYEFDHFLESITNIVMAIQSGEILGYEYNQELSEEVKTELIKYLKERTYKVLEDMKNQINVIFGE